MFFRLQLIFAIVAFFSFWAFRISFFRKRKIGVFGFFELFTFIILPGLMVPIAFFMLQDIIQRPPSKSTYFKDIWLILLIFMAVFYAYGGAAIHFIAKSLATVFRERKHASFKEYRINEFFHRPLSHNLGYIGVFLATLGLSLIELNHLSESNQSQVVLSVIAGMMIGTYYIFGLIHFKQHWGELKFIFVAIWLFLTLLVYRVIFLADYILHYPITTMFFISFLFVWAFSLYVIFVSMGRKIGEEERIK